MRNVVTLKDVKIQLGELCKQYRKTHELSREELADALNVSSTTIQNFENGKNATLDTMLKIAYHFDLIESFYKALKDIENDKGIKSLY